MATLRQYNFLQWQLLDNTTSYNGNSKTMKLLSMATRKQLSTTTFNGNFKTKWSCFKTFKILMIIGYLVRQSNYVLLLVASR